jgi:hypothetical protein
MVVSATFAFNKLSHVAANDAVGAKATDAIIAAASAGSRRWAFIIFSLKAQLFHDGASDEAPAISFKV